MPPPHVEFRFRTSSPYANPSEIQRAAVDALLASKHRSGIVICPCGSGKTAVLIEVAMKLAARSKTSSQSQRVLILCYESQGVLQIADALRNHTTLGQGQVCVQTGRQKDVPGANFCFLVTTYAMFSSSSSGRSESGKKVRAYVERTAFDVVLCDEVHHICAPTYRTFLEMLQKKADRMLGFTATLYRNDSVVEETRKEHERRMFGWFGPVIYHATAGELERAGLVAKIRRAEVRVELTREFALAHAHARGSEKTYVSALNPHKLNAIACICKIHEEMGHTGIVFAAHLLTAKVLRVVLGEGWEILSGSNAHGVEEQHTAEVNAKIVKRFNSGKLLGIISTAVGESSLNLDSAEFRYVVEADGDGGSASAAQKLGRVARTLRVRAEEGESLAQLRERRLLVQKSAAYYEINTCGTADAAAAERRVVEFAAEGYPQTTSVPYEDLVAWAAEESFELPHTTLVCDMELLKEITTYGTLGESAVLARSASAAVKAPTKAKMKKHTNAAVNAPNKVKRLLAKRNLSQLSRSLPSVNERAVVAKDRVLGATQLPRRAVELFRKIDLPLAVQDAIGIGDQVLLETTDDEDELD